MTFISRLKSPFRQKPELTEESIRKFLGKLPAGKGLSFADAGIIHRVSISGKSASVLLQHPTEGDFDMESLKQLCQASLESLDILEAAKVLVPPPRRANPSVGEKAGPTTPVRGRSPSGTPGTDKIKPEGLKDVHAIVAIASGKGGVGKSTTTTNLAYALANEGAKVGILDADIYGPSIPTMMPTGPAQSPDGKLIIPPEREGIKVISLGLFQQPHQAAILRGPMAGNLIKQFLSQVQWGHLDYLLIDYPPGTGDIQLSLSQSAPISGAILVTTPQNVALADVQRAIHMFHTTGIPLIGVIETMSYFICDSCDKRHTIFSHGGGEMLAREHGVPLLGQIPLEPAVMHCCDEGVNLLTRHPDSPSAKAYKGASAAARLEIERLVKLSNESVGSLSLDWNSHE